MPLLLLILIFKNISALDVLNWANMITNSSSSNEFQSVIDEFGCLITKGRS